jgi:hypothetical protein
VNPVPDRPGLETFGDIEMTWTPSKALADAGKLSERDTPSRSMALGWLLSLPVVLASCADTADPADDDTTADDDDTAADDDSGGDDDSAGDDDTAADDDSGGDDDTSSADPFADAVHSFMPGPNAGFGQNGYPDIVLGPPIGGGNGGGLDVLSLGNGGVIVLEFTDIGLVDGPGVDLIVFENAFAGWAETGVVAISDDGETWAEWPCDAANVDDGYPGCAGFANVWSTPDNGIDPTDPAVAGGDPFDLADLGVESGRFVRIRDSGANSYAGTSGGFDLDAVAIVHGELL